jgi:N-acetylglucosamine-6-phosphate deacetylase
MKLGVQAGLVDGLLLLGDVEVANGVVSRVGIEGSPGKGIAVPGFVDLQVNGFGGVDFLDADADGYRRAGAALLECGVTAYLPTFITSPERQLVAAMREVPVDEQRPRILGMHLEGPSSPRPGSARTRPPRAGTQTSPCSIGSSMRHQSA